MPSEPEVFEKVKTCLVEALGVDDDEVTPEASIMGDLGAESIDWLDIVFRLERAFSIKIPHGELSPEDILTNTEYVQDGKVTSAGLNQLKQRMPFADLYEVREQSRGAGLSALAHGAGYGPVCGEQVAA